MINQYHLTILTKFKMNGNIIKVSALIVALCSLFQTLDAVSSGLALPAKVEERSRVKREGFGPWEAQETWDEKGKPVVWESIVKAAKFIAKEEEILVNMTQAVIDEVVEVIHHPIQELTKTRLGKFILAFALLAVCLLVARVAMPILRGLWTVICYIWRALYASVAWIIRIMRGAGCCMTFCAMAPLVKIRNFFTARKIAKDDRKRMQIYRGISEEVELVTKATSRAYMDADGVYLDAGNGKRVYLDKRFEAEDMIRINFARGTEREEVPSVRVIKETILSSSKLYKVDKLPEFQGQFEIEGTLIGHFSRIRYQNKDCIITAYHVLEYNRSGLISMRKGDKSVRMDTVRSRIIVASPSNELDFIIMEMPSFVFSTLGLKTGQWSLRAQPREPVMIYQSYEGKPCVSSASVAMSETKPWHVKYGASTISGSSGAPILNSRSQIIGVHLEHDSDLGCNVGVIPPVFRNYKKESAAGNDIAHAEDDMEEETEEDRAQRLADQKMEEDEAVYRMIAFNYVKDIGYDANVQSWAEHMDEIDTMVERNMKDKYGESYEDRTTRVFKTKTGITGKHIGARVKGGKYRKESPWTCSKCYTIHQDKGYGCVKCGFALVRGPVAKKEKVKLAKEAVKDLPILVQDIIMSKVVQDYIEALVVDRVTKLLNVTEREKVSLYPNLDALKPSAPPLVSVEKKFLQKLKTHEIAKEDYNNFTKVSSKEGKVKLNQCKLAFDQERSEREGGVCFNSEVVETVAVLQPVKGLTRSARRRARANEKAKETQVPLNSQAPASTGAPITNGSKKNPSPRSQCESVSVKSECTEQARKQKARGGKPSKNSILSTKDMAGQTVAQKQKNRASSCSVTNTLQNTESLPKGK